MFRPLLSSLFLAALIATDPAAAQQDGNRPPPAPPSDWGEEITVIGEREEDVEPQVEVDASNPTYGASPRLMYGLVRRFFSCSGRIDADQVSSVIDAKPNTLGAAMALDKIIRRNSACNATRVARFEQQAPYYGECYPAWVGRASVCQSFFYRGGMFDQALEHYLEGQPITRTQTYDPAIAARFLATEIPRNDARHPQDRRFFEVAACMVQHQPVLARRLAEPGLPRETRMRVQQRLIDAVPRCIGNAQRLRVDSEELRIYLAEAVYRWAVAVRGVDSLLSPEPGRS